jgi:hypothetical protein
LLLELFYFLSEFLRLLLCWGPFDEVIDSSKELPNLIAYFVKATDRHIGVLMDILSALPLNILFEFCLGLVPANKVDIIFLKLILKEFDGIVFDGNMYTDVSLLYFAKERLDVLICDYDYFFLEMYFSCSLHIL